jgi:hypothetical protein
MSGLPRAVKDSLQKARDSALLAVEVYNKPAVAFKSGCYITLMVIAWTSLFHAIFYRKGRKPYYWKSPRRYERVGGDYKHWELGECLKQYYGNGIGSPVRKNLEFFIPLRNKIEHRSLPEIDSTIFGECQAMLLNFDAMLEKEFGTRYCLRQSLSFALQMYPSSSNLAEAVKRNRAARAAADFIEQYRSSISADVLQSGQYAFKAFLIQVANHESKDALPIQFIHYDMLPEEQKKHLQPLVAMVKYKQPVVANEYVYSPKEVVARVRTALDDSSGKDGTPHIREFGMGWHTRCWRHFRVRPPSGYPNPEQTDTKYCVYDKRHGDYSYTDEWVRFLTAKLKAHGTYEEVFVKAGEVSK